MSCLVFSIVFVGSVLGQNPHLLSLHYVSFVRFEIPLDRCTCLYIALRPISLDAGARHDVIDWYYFIVFFRSSPRVGHQVEDAHGF
jgi:hypothetical protein